MVSLGGSGPKGLIGFCYLLGNEPIEIVILNGVSTTSPHASGSKTRVNYCRLETDLSNTLFATYPLPITLERAVVVHRPFLFKGILMSRYAQHVSTRVTPQTQPIPGKPMVANSAGGFSFAVDKWKRLDRFLILGSEGGSYYASEKKLTIENATCIRECLAEDAARTINTIVAISDSGRAPKNSPAIFALAMAAGYSVKDHEYPAASLAFDVLPKVARIGTDLFQFAESVQAFRGWGRGLRKGIAAWYTGKEAGQLAYQMAKYQQREGWSHRDLLRLSHPAAPSLQHDALFRWAVGGMEAVAGRSVKPKGEGEPEVYGSVAEHLPPMILAMEAAKTAEKSVLLKLITENDLPRECIPTQHLNSPEVWEALLQKMPLRALIRNLGKMTDVGLLKPMSVAAKLAGDKLGDGEYILKSRLHPLAILIALKTYGSGHGVKGSLTWQPVSQINDALDAAFYKAFANVVPSGKRTLIGLDVSGSMSSGGVAGSILTPREAAAAMAMVIAKTEPSYHLMAFSHRFVPLDISKCSRLSDVVQKTNGLPFEATDCSLPMTWALESKINVDTFLVMTDNETYAGRIHPSQALQQYRQKMAIPSKSVVVGMVSNGFTIADPADAGMLDVVGMDASAPAVIADFARD